MNLSFLIELKRANDDGILTCGWQPQPVIFLDGQLAAQFLLELLAPGTTTNDEHADRMACRWVMLKSY